MQRCSIKSFTTLRYRIASTLSRCIDADTMTSGSEPVVVACNSPSHLFPLSSETKFSGIHTEHMAMAEKETETEWDLKDIHPPDKEEVKAANEALRVCREDSQNAQLSSIMRIPQVMFEKVRLRVEHVKCAPPDKRLRESRKYIRRLYSNGPRVPKPVKRVDRSTMEKECVFTT